MNCTKSYRVKITPANLPTPVLWWKMEEPAASDRIDQVVGAVLAQANAPAQAVGKINFCAQLNPPAGNSDGLVGVGASWPYAGNGFTVAGWFLYQNSAANTQLFVQIRDSAAFIGGIETTTLDGSFKLASLFGGSTAFASPTENVWHFFILELNGGNLNLEFDRSGSIVTVASPSPTVGNDMLLYFSCGNGAFGSLTFSVDEIGVFDGVLTSDQKDGLHNSGNGVTYPY